MTTRPGTCRGGAFACWHSAFAEATARQVRRRARRYGGTRRLGLRALSKPDDPPPRGALRRTGPPSPSSSARGATEDRSTFAILLRRRLRRTGGNEPPPSLKLPPWRGALRWTGRRTGRGNAFFRQEDCERCRRGISVEPNAERASSSFQERHLPRLADQQIHTNRICRPDGALDFVGGQFYIDTAPTALDERVLCKCRSAHSSCAAVHYVGDGCKWAESLLAQAEEQTRGRRRETEEVIRPVIGNAAARHPIGGA